jgi:hypothetical protein
MVLSGKPYIRRVAPLPATTPNQRDLILHCDGHAFKTDYYLEILDTPGVDSK